MKRCKLRIAWSVAWGIVAVLVCVLWVWNYSSPTHIPHRMSSGPALELLSFNGSIDFHKWPAVAPGAWRRTPTIRIQIPNSLIAIALAATATTPWISWSKRFTLRTLLIATTLVAVGLGLIVWLTR